MLISLTSNNHVNHVVKLKTMPPYFQEIPSLECLWQIFFRCLYYLSTFKKRTNCGSGKIGNSLLRVCQESLMALRVGLIITEKKKKSMIFPCYIAEEKTLRRWNRNTTFSIAAQTSSSLVLQQILIVSLKQVSLNNCLTITKGRPSRKKHSSFLQITPPHSLYKPFGQSFPFCNNILFCCLKLSENDNFDSIQRSLMMSLMVILPTKNHLSWEEF